MSITQSITHNTHHWDVVVYYDVLPSSGYKLTMFLIPILMVVLTALCICAGVGIRGSRQRAANVAVLPSPDVKVVTQTMTPTENTAPPPYPASSYPSIPANSPPPYPAESSSFVSVTTVH